MREKSKVIRTQIGRVVSNKMDKTIRVVVERRVKHPKYKKITKDRSTFLVHDEEGICKVGDLVMFKEGRRISKNKSCTLVNVLEKVADKSEVNL